MNPTVAEGLPRVTPYHRDHQAPHHRRYLANNPAPRYPDTRVTGPTLLPKGVDSVSDSPLPTRNTRCWHWRSGGHRHRVDWRRGQPVSSRTTANLHVAPTLRKAAVCRTRPGSRVATGTSDLSSDDREFVLTRSDGSTTVGSVPGPHQRAHSGRQRESARGWRVLMCLSPNMFTPRATSLPQRRVRDDCARTRWRMRSAPPVLPGLHR